VVEDSHHTPFLSAVSTRILVTPRLVTPYA
jgi:hypothetical protein